MSAGRRGHAPRLGRRTAATLAAGALAAATLAGCGGAAAQPEPTPDDAVAAVVEAEPTVRVASLRGPTTMALVGLARDVEAGTAGHDYAMTTYGTPDEVVPRIVQGEVDVALLPANLTAVLHARTAGTDAAIQVAATSSLGTLEVLEHGDTVHEIGDLAGRTVLSPGKGTAPEHVLADLLRGSGLEPGVDVAVEFSSEATEVAARLASEPGAIAVLPQPYATAITMGTPGVRRALSLTDVWAQVHPHSQIVTSVLVVRRAFAEEHPDLVAGVLDDVEASNAWVAAHPADAAPLVVAAGIAPSDAVAEAAIPASGLEHLEGAAVRDALEGYLAVLHAADPASVGGSMPGDDFYLAP